MRLLHVCLALLLLVQGSLQDDFRFLVEFFKGREARVTFKTCWRKDTILQFYKSGEFGLAADFVVVDLNECTKGWTFLEKLRQDRPEKSLVLLFNEEKSKLESYNFFVDSNVFVVHRNQSVLEISQVYKILPTSAMIWERYGTWMEGGLLVEYLRNVPEARRRRNLQGTKFQVELLLEDEDTFNHLEEFRYPWIDVYTKQNYGPLKALFEHINITVDFRRVFNYSHLKVEEEKFDFKTLLTASAPYLSPPWLKHIDFLHLQAASKLCFVMKEPPTSFVTTIFTDAFTISVWYATLAILVLLSIVYFILLNIEARRQKIKNQENFTTFDLALIAFEAICQQGTSTDPKSYSARILAVIMFAAFMFLYVSYSANILVLLQSTSAIESIQQLDDFGIEYAGMDTSGMPQYNAIDEEDVFVKAVNGKATMSIDEAMKRVRAGYFAYYSESDYSYNYVKRYFTDYETCGLQEIVAKYGKNLGYVAVRKGSPFTEILKVGLLRMEEYGFRARHYLGYFLKPRCFLKSSSFDAVGIAETYQILLLFVIGLFVGLGIFFVEKFGIGCWKRQKHSATD